MSSYANKATKEAFVRMYTCVDSVKLLLETDFLGKSKVKRNLKAVENHAWKVCDAIMEDLDEDQRKGMIRFVKNSDVTPIPKSDVRHKKELYIVPEEEFNRLILSPGNECCFCTKEGKEIKRCQRRKDLAGCGLAGDDKSECPYQM